MFTPLVKTHGKVSGHLKLDPIKTKITIHRCCGLAFQSVLGHLKVLELGLQIQRLQGWCLSSGSYSKALRLTWLLKWPIRLREVAGAHTSSTALAHNSASSFKASWVPSTNASHITSGTAQTQMELPLGFKWLDWQWRWESRFFALLKSAQKSLDMLDWYWISGWWCCTWKDM